MKKAEAEKTTELKLDAYDKDTQAIKQKMHDVQREINEIRNQVDKLSLGYNDKPSPVTALYDVVSNFLRASHNSIADAEIELGNAAYWQWKEFRARGAQ